jgi:biopolymer transport protein ExbB/TolQ
VALGFLIRLTVHGVALLGAIVMIAVLSVALPEAIAEVLLDIRRETYPFTVQNIMWVIFFSGLAELSLRLYSTILEDRQIERRYLPEDAETVLQPGPDLEPIYKKVRSSKYRDTCFLPRLLSRCILHFNISRSVDQTSSLLNSSLDLFIHEIDLRYSIIRYITWLIPSLGFIGTVLGIMLALNYAGNREAVQDPNMLYEVTSRLGVAFSTTLVALLFAAVLVLAHNVIQAREERSLNRAGQYCLDNLINRLYVR